MQHASEPENLVTPRITMIVALDNYGDVYLSLMQSNTNTDTFCNYLSHLIEQLDRDRPNWRKNTIIQMDGASWHKTDQVKSLLRKQQVPILISSPYSFDSSVAELFFNMFKRNEINIQQLATSKSK